MGKLDRLRANQATLDAQVAAKSRELQGLVSLGDALSARLIDQATRDVHATDAQLILHEGGGLPPQELDWEHPAWGTWPPAQETEEEGRTRADRELTLRGRLRVGGHVDARMGTSLGVADTVPLVGSGRSLLITSQGADGAARAEALLQSIVARLALTFAERTKFVLLEPAHSGGPLVRMAKALHDVHPASSRDQVRAALDAVIARIEQIGKDNLSSTKPTFEDLDLTQRLDIGMQFVVASDVPARLGEREIEALDVVATDGPEKGTYAIVHWNLDHEMPITVRSAPFARATRVDVNVRRGRLAGRVPTTVRLDTIGGDAEARLEAMERPSLDNQTIDWFDLIDTPAAMWTEDATTSISTPLVVGGAGDAMIPITFGKDAEDQSVSHGVVAGSTGQGKSSFLHSLICGLSVRYPPQELNLYLIDGKSGLEFEVYRTLPHAKVVSLRTPPDLSRSVLAELEVEMSRRSARFTDAGANDLPGYRRTPGAVPTPRILCVVDEFQEVFQGNDDEGMRLLSTLTEKGRAYGIHLLLASQGYQPTGLRNAGKFYSNVALRIALPIDRAELEAVDLFGGSAGRQKVLATCTTRGRVVVNDRGGSARNQPGRVAYIDKDDVAAVVARCAALPDAAGRHPEVFHGSRAPRLADHPLVAKAGAAPGWPTSDQLTDLARTPCSGGGLGHPRWQAGEGPVLVGLGRGLDVHTHTSAMIRRGAAENVVIVGSSEPERLGMLLGAAGLMSLVHGPDRLQLRVLDRTIANSEHANLLTDAVVDLVAGRHDIAAVGPTAGATSIPITDGAGAQAGMIEAMAAEVERRLALPEADVAAQPSIVLLTHDLDRCEALRQIDDRFGSSPSPLGTRFELVLDKGPGVGVHTVASFSFVKAAKDVVGDAGLNRWFRHRVALQMSDDESFELLRSSAAAKLPAAGAELGSREAVTALYLDRQSNATVAFKPYTTFEALKGDGSVIDDLEEIARLEAGWGGA